MTPTQEQAVRELEASFEGQIDRLFFWENIPQKKLKNALKSYGLEFETGEVPIYLWDDTIFGSAKDGFLLSDRRLYQKNIVERSSSSELSGIIDFDLSKTSSGFHLIPKGRTELNTIKIQYQCGNQEAVAARLIHMIYALTGRVVGVEQEESNPEMSSGGATLLVCPGCGAAITPNAIFCEYCGGRFR